VSRERVHWLLTSSNDDFINGNVRTPLGVCMFIAAAHDASSHGIRL
jgi:hypothetical protein